MSDLFDRHVDWAIRSEWRIAFMTVILPISLMLAVPLAISLVTP